VTTEQLATIVAVRYLTTVREWQQSSVPVERRWRQLRVMMQDVMKLRRGEQLAERLALDWERLQFAVERFEDEKQADERRAMVAFLVAAKQWPEVAAALTAAFRMLQERKGAEMEAIKVNQGEIFSKNEGDQIGFVGCSPSPQSSPPRKGGDLTRFWVQESVTTSATLGGTRTAENLGKLKPIKVNQGEIFLNSEEAQDEIGDGGWHPRPCRDGARRSEFAGQRPALPVAGRARTDAYKTGLWKMKVGQGEIFSPTKMSRTRTRTRTRRNRSGCEMARQGGRTWLRPGTGALREWGIALCTVPPGI
jgi:hypothetical protein